MPGSRCPTPPVKPLTGAHLLGLVKKTGRSRRKVIEEPPAMTSKPKYWMKSFRSRTALRASEFSARTCTSEDINNTSHACNCSAANELFGIGAKVIDNTRYVVALADVRMLSHPRATITTTTVGETGQWNVRGMVYPRKNCRHPADGQMNGDGNWQRPLGPTSFRPSAAT
jgi:adenylosuccinate lyase